MLAVTVRVVEGTETGPVFYEVNHQRDGRAWVARERYSALSAMADALRAENAELPEVRFPPKLWSRMLAVWRDPCTPALPPDEMEERRSGLQAYLSALSELKDSWSSDTVTRVLCSQQAGSSADPAAAIEVKALVSDPQSEPRAVDTQEQQQQQQPAAEAEAASALLSLSSSPPNRPGVDYAFSTGVASAVAGSSTPDVVAVRTGHKEGGQKQAAVAAGTATATTADVVKPRGETVTENRASAAAVSKVTNASAPASASASTKTKTRGRDAPPYSPIAVSSTEDVKVPSMPASAYVTSNGKTVAGTTTDGTNQEAEKTASSSSSSSPDVSRGGRLLSAVIADVDRVAAQQANAGAFVPVPTSSLVLPAAFDTKVPSETKSSTGGDDEFARDREVASAVSALALSSATEGDGNEEHGGVSSRVSLSSDNSIAETPSATKRRTSLLGRAKRSLSSKKPGGKNKSGRIPANIVGDENPTEAPSNAPVTPGSRASGLGRLSSFRDRARSLKGRLSGGGGGGPLSLNSARGAGKGFFSMSGTTPEEGDGTAAATAVSVAAAKSVATKDAERTQSMAATVSPASPASPSLDGLEAIPKVTEEFMAVGNSKGGSVSFATPPSPGGD